MTRVRNMGRILSAFLMLGISSMCGAQIYKYLGIEDGLSNRRIYRIQKDGGIHVVPHPGGWTVMTASGSGITLFLTAI